MTTMELENTAKELGLEVEHANRQQKGYLRVSGKASEVLRAWTMSGFDRKCDGDNSYSFYMNGEYAGCAILHDSEDFAYSYSSCI